MSRPQVLIYTDGSARPNPGGPGGWAALLICQGVEREISGNASSTTNNRMELTAAIMALEALRQPCEATLHTDSQYLRNGITTWLPNWLRNGWQTANRRPVKNRELWERLHKAAHGHEIRWCWLRGHAGNAHNERVDRLASAARERLT